MRDLIISVICLMLLVIPWYIYDSYSSKTVNNYKQIISSEIIPAIEDGDWEKAEKRFDYITKDWDKFRKTSAFFIDTEAVNDTDRIISKVFFYIKLKDASEAAGEISYLKYSFDCLHENELPTMGNVF